jgi:hypothetical protein
MEGAHCIDRLKPRQPPASCPDKDAGGRTLEWPVVEYANMQVAHPDSRHLGLKGVGTAITAARMVRGSAYPALKDKLLFADWSASFREASGQLFAAAPSEQPRTLWPFERVAQVASRIIGLAENGAGEIFVLTHEGLGPTGSTGKVFKLVAR